MTLKVAAELLLAYIATKIQQQNPVLTLQTFTTHFCWVSKLSDCSLSQGFESENGHVGQVVAKNIYINVKSTFSIITYPKTAMVLSNILYKFLNLWRFCILCPSESAVSIAAVSVKQLL